MVFLSWFRCLFVGGKSKFMVRCFMLNHVALMLQMVCLFEIMSSVVIILVSIVGLWYVILVMSVPSCIWWVWVVSAFSSV